MNHLETSKKILERVSQYPTTCNECQNVHRHSNEKDGNPSWRKAGASIFRTSAIGFWAVYPGPPVLIPSWRKIGILSHGPNIRTWKKTHPHILSRRPCLWGTRTLKYDFSGSDLTRCSRMFIYSSLFRSSVRDPLGDDLENVPDMLMPVKNPKKKFAPDTLGSKFRYGRERVERWPHTWNGALNHSTIMFEFQRTIRIDSFFAVLDPLRALPDVAVAIILGVLPLCTTIIAIYLNYQKWRRSPFRGLPYPPGPPVLLGDSISKIQSRPWLAYSDLARTYGMSFPMSLFFLDWLKTETQATSCI